MWTWGWILIGAIGNLLPQSPSAGLKSELFQRERRDELFAGAGDEQIGHVAVFGDKRSPFEQVGL